MTSFTQEELARLVQFITGSSQLPPGGFAELSPPIQISSAPTADALPTAHTWWVKYRIFRVSPLPLPPPPAVSVGFFFVNEAETCRKDVLSKEFFLNCWRKRKISVERVCENCPHCAPVFPVPERRFQHSANSLTLCCTHIVVSFSFAQEPFKLK